MGKVILLDGAGLNNKALITELESSDKTTKCVIFYKKEDTIEIQLLSVLIPHMKTKDFIFIEVSDQELFCVEFGKLLGSCSENDEIYSLLPENMVSKKLSDAYGLKRLGATKVKKTSTTRRTTAKKMKVEKVESAVCDKNNCTAPSKSADSDCMASGYVSSEKITEPKKSNEIRKPKKESVKVSNAAKNKEKVYVLKETDRRLLNEKIHVPCFSTAEDPKENRDQILSIIGAAFHKVGADQDALRAIFEKEFGKVNAKRLMEAIANDIPFLSTICSV